MKKNLLLNLLLIPTFGCHAVVFDLAQSRMAVSSFLEEPKADWEFSTSRRADGTVDTKISVQRSNSLDAVQNALNLLQKIK